MILNQLGSAASDALNSQIMLVKMQLANTGIRAAQIPLEQQLNNLQKQLAGQIATDNIPKPAPPPAPTAYVSLAPAPVPAPVSQPAPIPQLTTTQTAPITGAIATIAQQSATVAPVSSSGAATLVPTTGGSDYMTMFEAAKAADVPSGSITSQSTNTKTETVTDNKNVIYIGVGLAALILLSKKGKRK